MSTPEERKRRASKTRDAMRSAERRAAAKVEPLTEQQVAELRRLMRREYEKDQQVRARTEHRSVTGDR